jgi:hypothetical protein
MKHTYHPRTSSVYAFFSFDYKQLDIGEAGYHFCESKSDVSEPHLSIFLYNALYQVLSR